VITDPLIGRQLDNYRLERLLGRGGMASVYYATDVRLNRPVAVKIIDAHFRDQEKYNVRFIREARSVATWRHEHIVQMYYAGDEDGLYYFAMEYIDGTTLAQILADQKAQGSLLPPADVLRYGRAIASALDYAHQKGVVHRDVKPLNVLVAADGRIVLSDFGLALDTAEGSLGEVFGSAHYIAPEQARRSNAAVPQSDLYSLGVILYEMLTGVLPFDDPSPTSIALQHLTLEPPSPREINPGLSKAVEAVLLKALSKKPEGRYQTGAALMDALETALQARPAGLLATQPPAAAPLPPTPSGTPRPAPVDAAPASARPAAWLLWVIPAVLICLVAGVLAGSTVLRLVRGPTAQNLSPTISPTSALADPNTTVLPPSSTMTVTHTPLTTLAASLPAISPTPTPSPLPTGTPPTPATSTSSGLIPSPTLKYTDRRRFVLYYNESSFYMLQTSGVGDVIGGVTFERLDADLQPLFDRFSSNRWAEHTESSLSGWCFRLEIKGAKDYLNPAECQDHYLATIHLQSKGSEIFWTPQDGSQYFRVLWHEEDLVHCEISAGTCEVYLP
jgi:serine/threonine protein kinase